MSSEQASTASAQRVLPNIDEGCKGNSVQGMSGCADRSASWGQVILWVVQQEGHSPACAPLSSGQALQSAAAEEEDPAASRIQDRQAAPESQSTGQSELLVGHQRTIPL